MYWKTTEQNRQLNNLRHVSLLIATFAVCIVNIAQAGQPLAIKITTPQQLVQIGEQLALFESCVVICDNQQADGFWQLMYRDGTFLTLTPIAAKVHCPPDNGPLTVTMVLLPDLDRPARPGDFVVATSTLNNVDPDGVIWDMTGSTVQGGPTPGRLQFSAEASWRPTNERCRAHDFGQLKAWAAIHAPLQDAQRLDGGDPLRFEALLCIDSDNVAEGFIFAPLSERGGCYELFFGALLPDSNAPRGFGTFIVAARRDPRSTDDVLRATVTPGTVNPDCVIWDLMNGVTGEVQNAATIDAQTMVKIGQGRR